MPAEGPWYVEERFAPEMYLVRHRVNGNVPDKKFTSQLDAMKHAAELNAAERVRDAGPQLLAALKIAEDWLLNATFDRIGRTQEEYNAAMDQIAAAIKAAKGTG